MLLADDDAGIQTAVSRLLSLSCDVVGCVADSPSLFEAVVRLRPDVVLLDFSLPGSLGAIEVVRRLKAIAPDVPAVAFTAANDEDLKAMALEAGAAAFVWKLQVATDLLSAIRAVVDGPADSGDAAP